MSEGDTDQVVVNQLVRVAEGMGWKLLVDNRMGGTLQVTLWRAKTGVFVEPASNLP